MMITEMWVCEGQKEEQVASEKNIEYGVRPTKRSYFYFPQVLDHWRL